MIPFCFNDCIPKSSNEFEVVSCFEKVLKEYNKVKKIFPETVEGIISEQEPSKIILIVENRFSLFDCIQKVKDKTLKMIALKSFTKYPIEDKLSIQDQDNLLSKNYTIKINQIDINALNLKIIAENEGILFTLAVHDDLKRDLLKITDNAENIFEIKNLYGNETNTQFIATFIRDSIKSKLGNFEKLLTIIGKNSYNENFKKSFDNLSKQVQDSIILHFEKAIKRDGVSYFYSDHDLIKDVTPIRKNIKVFELRIFKPVAYRIYFYETKQKIFLALVEKKPPKKVQDNQIQNAVSIINELILLEPTQ